MAVNNKYMAEKQGPATCTPDRLKATVTYGSFHAKSKDLLKILAGHPLRFCYKSFPAYHYGYNEHPQKISTLLQAVSKIWPLEI